MTVRAQEFAEDGERRSAGGNEPFLVRGAAAWLVAEGRIDLFSVKLEDGRPAGRRVPLFSVAAGDLLAAGRRGEPHGAALLAVGTSGTEVVEVPLDTLAWRAASRPPDDPLRRGVEEWAGRVCAEVAPGVGPDAGALLGGDGEGPAKVEAGTVLRPDADAVWVRQVTGATRVCGLEGEARRVAPGDTVPVADPGWLEAVSDGAEVVVDPSPPADGVRSALAFLHGMLETHGRERMRARRREEKEALERRTARKGSVFRRAWLHLADVMNPEEAPRRRVAPSGPQDDEDLVLAACRVVGDHLGVAVAPPPDGATAGSLSEDLAAVARSSQFRARPVTLRGDWWRDDGGALIAELDGRPVAMLPSGTGGYRCHDPAEGRELEVDEELADDVAPAAHGLMRTFDDEPKDARDLVRFGTFRCRREIAVGLGLGFLWALLGLVTPIATGVVIDEIIPSAGRGALYQVLAILLVVALASSFMAVGSWIALLRTQAKAGSDLLTAVWDRVLSLPVSFFRQYSAGELASRAMSVDKIRRILSSATQNALVMGLFSLVQFGLLFHYSPLLATVAIGLFVILGLVTAVGSYQKLQYQREAASVRNSLAGRLLQFLGNITKLRVAGAEVHAFSKWAHPFSKQRSLRFQAGMIANGMGVFHRAFPLFSSLLLFGLAVPFVGPAMSTGDFMAFMAAFTAVTTGMLAVSQGITSTLAVVPHYEQAKPILEARPENRGERKHPGELSGRVSARHLSFRYDPDGELVLEDVSFEVEAGEFVALAGPSGGGKSTLLRLLLGFERPETGAVYFDDHDLGGLDLRAVRRQMGVVLQDARPIPGDVFTNIAGDSGATVEDAWEAAGIAGLAEEIESMPMGMHTVIGEGASTLSGGQQQRLMLARALVREPKYLFLDEATSALDNRTQSLVSDNVDRLSVTRIVIAHRLSTIQDADRILVMDDGEIVQRGPYRTLMDEEGLFEELARRQLA